jgi:CheY-like chemotaxis protein
MLDECWWKGQFMRTKQTVILQVEDDSNDQFLVKMAFRKIGVTCPVFAVGDGEEAIRYLRGKEPYADRNRFPLPTVLMIDLKMPKMNGFELLTYLKKNPGLVVVPTVIFTSSTDRNDVANAFLLGANAYHVKPPSLEELCTQLKILHDYWDTCEMPELDEEGNLVPTHGGGKLSENIPKPVRKAA